MADQSSQKLQISGMTCANCALGVRKHMEKAGLEAVDVNFVNGEAYFDNPQNLDLQPIVSGIRQLGYQVDSNQTSKKPSKPDLTLERYFLFSLLLTLPLMGHMWVGPDSILNNPLFQIALSSPVYCLGFWYFGRSAWASIKVGVPNMDVLIFIGATSAFGYSLYGVIRHWGSPELHQYLFFETAATIITLVLLGNVIEKRSVRRTTDAIKGLQGLQKKTALTLRHEKWQVLSIEELVVNDLIRIREGEQIPVDGEIQSGSGRIDESMLTGESQTVEKSTGSTVFAGTLLHEGVLEVKMSKKSDETVLSGIVQLVKDAQRDQPTIQKLGDRVSAIFVPVVMAISLATFAISFRILGVGLEASLMRSIAVLVISCPCAMGLATPTAVMVGIGRAARKGILIKGGSTLEELARAETVVFDKTGTLTTGEFRVKRIESISIDLKDLQSIVLGLELHSDHPIATSLVEAWKDQVTPYPFENVKELKGRGITGRDDHGQEFSVLADGRQADLLVLRNKEVIGYIDIEDDWKTGVPELIEWLNQNEIRSIMLSGDLEHKCRRLAERVGITEFYARQSPEDKIRHIRMWSKKEKVVMVGDGINDAPALTQANVGISMVEASDIAIDSSEVVLLQDRDLNAVKSAIQISRHTLLTIQQNLFWAFFYNVLAIPIAAAGLLSPMIAALSMAFSDVVVIGNSLRLRIKRIQ
ncbi:cadmium-translocating P-type ATPase [Cryomorphaceae bacterium]|nr:cadmium-translocating P-type ATPase [Cryomorphaceae bacterium]